MKDCISVSGISRPAGLLGSRVIRDNLAHSYKNTDNYYLWH